MTIYVTCNKNQLLMNHSKLHTLLNIFFYIRIYFPVASLESSDRVSEKAAEVKPDFRIDHSRVAQEIFLSVFSSHFARDPVAVYWLVKEQHYFASSLADYFASGFLIGLNYFHRLSSRCLAFQLFQYRLQVTRISL